MFPSILSRRQIPKIFQDELIGIITVDCVCVIVRARQYIHIYIHVLYVCRISSYDITYK